MTGPAPSWQTVPVRGTYRLPDGTPHQGYVRFTFPQRVTDNTDKIIFPSGGRIDVQLDINGGFVIDAPATDDPDNSPATWSIKVEENLQAGGGSTYYIAPSLDMLPGGLDLSTLTVDSLLRPMTPTQQDQVNSISARQTVVEDRVEQFAANQGPPTASSRLVSWTDSTGVYQDTASRWFGPWPSQVAAISNGRMDLTHNASVSGNTTKQMLSRFAADVAPYDPTVVVLGNITNDILQGIDLAVTRANILAMIVAAQSTGAQVVLHTSVPFAPTGATSAQRLQLAQYNRWLLEQGARLRLPVAACFAALVDPASNGTWGTRNGLPLGQPDGLHPTAEGWAVMAEQIWAALTGSAGRLTPVGTGIFNGDPLSLIGNGLMLAVADGNGLADGWSTADAINAGTVARSIIADAAMPGGKAQRISTSGLSGAAGIAQAVGIGWSPGDVLEFVAAVNVASIGALATLTVQTFGGSDAALISQAISTQGRSVLRRRLIVPQGTGGILLQLQSASNTTTVTGNLDVGGVIVRNLTTSSVL